MGKIARYLNQLTVGNVFDSTEILDAYSTDRSVLKIKPRAVAFPESTDDICKLMKFCYQLAAKDMKIPIAVRGSGMDETGADLTNGLVISTEKLNKLLESDRHERLVRVQAGITLRELNTALSVNGLTIPIAGHGDETIGGLIASYPIDDYAKKCGGIESYVERIEVVLANGDILQTSKIRKHALARKTAEKSLESDIYRKLDKIVTTKAMTIDALKKQPHNKSGYPGILKIKHHNYIDLKPIMFGAEGTLGVISEVILRAVPIKRPACQMVVVFEDFKYVERFLELINNLKPREVRLFDTNILKTAEETGKKLSDVSKKINEGYVAIIQFDNNSKARTRKILRAKNLLPRNVQLITDKNKSAVVIDELNSALTSYLNDSKNGERVPLLTDFYIPAENLGGFIQDLDVLHEKLGLNLALFGSYATSNYSLRPKFDLEDESFNKKAVAFLRAGAYIIKRRGGALAGGSTEGRVKAVAINNELPDDEKELYQEIKHIFDRYEMLNPDIKLGADTRSMLSHFRTTGSPKIVI